MSYLRTIGVPDRYQRIADEAPDLTLPDLSTGRWVFLFGPAGCGKTHRAVQILHAHFARVGKPRESQWRPWHHDPRPPAGPRFIDWPEHLATQRRAIAEDAEDASRCLLLKNPSPVILDDVGSERPTDFAVDALNSVISSRYNDCAPTVITSNLPLDKLASAYGDRIASRIHEAALVADQSGNDWRAARIHIPATPRP